MPRTRRAAVNAIEPQRKNDWRQRRRGAVDAGGALWPLALLYLVSCGALGVGSLALLRHESKRAPAKEEEDDRDLVALEGHAGSLPGEQDWLVVAFFLLVASYLGGLISLETGAAAR